MTEKLKILFEDEWRTAATDPNLREPPFREQMYAVLCGPNYVSGKNLKLKRPDGTEATDIDAVLYERTTNVIYLIQLKWPDVSVGE
jgi:hypothetical protein